MRAPIGKLAVLMACLATAGTSPGAAQSAPKEPDVVAGEFLRGFQAMAWDGTVQRIHPDALARFRQVVRMLVDTDSGDEVRDRLLGGVNRDGFSALADDEAFRRVMGALVDQFPGLTHSLTGRTHEVIGAVPEEPDRAHVVYRQLATIEGAEPEMRVMTLARTSGGGWGVLESDELDVLRSALRGIPFGR